MEVAAKVDTNPENDLPLVPSKSATWNPLSWFGQNKEGTVSTTGPCLLKLPPFVSIFIMNNCNLRY